MRDKEANDSVLFKIAAVQGQRAANIKYCKYSSERLSLREQVYHSQQDWHYTSEIKAFELNDHEGAAARKSGDSG